MRRFGCMLAAIVKQMRMKYGRRKHTTPALTEKIEKFEHQNKVTCNIKVTKADIA